MTTEPTDNEVKNKPESTDDKTPKRIQDSSQSFDKLGLFEVKNGDIVLRGRREERDHLYPIERAVARYYETQRMLMSMVKHGIRGWDTLSDVLKDLRMKILEACDQRRSLNRDIPKEALDFEKAHGSARKTSVLIDGTRKDD